MIRSTAPLPFYRFSLFESHAGALAHAIFTRQAGNIRYGIGDDDATVTQNRNIMKRFFEDELLGGRPTIMISANQTHSDHILALRDDEELPANVLNSPHYEIDDIDAFITNRRDVSLLIQVADCQPVLLYEPQAHVLGVVHSGWRGSLQNIIGKTVMKMHDEFSADPSKMIVGVGPSIGPCCQVFMNDDGQRVDFWKMTQDQLMAEGVPASQIEFSHICTQDTVDEFFSFQKEHRQTGRFGLLAALR